MHGSSDGHVTLHGTWQFFKDRKLKVKHPWTPILLENGSLIFGHYKQYENLSLVSLHGGGHSSIVS
jgi:hypothetical protein